MDQDERIFDIEHNDRFEVTHSIIFLYSPFIQVN